MCYYNVFKPKWKKLLQKKYELIYSAVNKIIYKYVWEKNGG